MTRKLASVAIYTICCSRNEKKLKLKLKFLDFFSGKLLESPNYGFFFLSTVFDDLKWMNIDDSAIRKLFCDLDPSQDFSYIFILIETKVWHEYVCHGNVKGSDQ